MTTFKLPTEADRMNDIDALFSQRECEEFNSELDWNDSRVAHVSYDSRMEEFYNEHPTFEETLDALWDGNLEYDTEE